MGEGQAFSMLSTDTRSMSGRTCRGIPQVGFFFCEHDREGGRELIVQIDPSRLRGRPGQDPPPTTVMQIIAVMRWELRHGVPVGGIDGVLEAATGLGPQRWQPDPGQAVTGKARHPIGETDVRCRSRNRDSRAQEGLDVLPIS